MKSEGAIYQINATEQDVSMMLFITLVVLDPPKLLKATNKKATFSTTDQNGPSNQITSFSHSKVKTYHFLKHAQ